MKQLGIFLAIGLFSAVSRAEPPAKITPRTKESVAADASRVIDVLIEIQDHLVPGRTISHQPTTPHFHVHETCEVSGTIDGDVFDLVTQTWSGQILVRRGSTLHFDKCATKKYFFDGTASFERGRNAIHASVAFTLYDDRAVVIARAAKAYFDAIRIDVWQRTDAGLAINHEFSGLLNEDGIGFQYNYGTSD